MKTWRFFLLSEGIYRVSKEILAETEEEARAKITEKFEKISLASVW